MRVVYITRDYKRSWKKDPKKVIGAMIKKAFYYFGVEGFFEASLHSASEADISLTLKEL